MNKFLLAVDGSESSGWAASHIAQRIREGEQLDVQLLNVQPKRPLHPALRKIVSPAMAEEYARSQAEEALHVAAAVLTGHGIAHSTHVAFGEAAYEIANHVQRFRIEQVVMGTRGQSALMRFAIGSVASRVVNLIDIPVTLVPGPVVDPPSAPVSGSPNPDPATPRATMVPVDGSECSQRAVEHAIRESASSGRRIALLNVQSPYPGGPWWDQVPRADLELAYQDWGNASLSFARRRLDEAGCGYHAETIVGSPAELIALRTRESGCDRIIMGTRGLGEGGSFFLGSVAVKVVHLVGVPVTLVR